MSKTQALEELAAERSTAQTLRRSLDNTAAYLANARSSETLRADAADETVTRLQSELDVVYAERAELKQRASALNERHATLEARVRTASLYVSTLESELADSKEMNVYVRGE
jgi:chromosome segregation ATPase